MPFFYLVQSHSLLVGDHSLQTVPVLAHKALGHLYRDFGTFGFDKDLQVLQVGRPLGMQKFALCTKRNQTNDVNRYGHIYMIVDYKILSIFSLSFY